MDNYEKAGKIAAEARDYGASLIIVGANLLEVTEKIENKIKELGGSIAFPPQISLNEVAAHYCAFDKDETVFKEGDLAKLDLGVHINGCIGDTAITVDLGDNKELVLASQDALAEAIKVIKPGVKLREIGKAIEKAITKRGFEPIRNLGGHGLGEYQIHTPPHIPNFDNGSEIELKEGQIVAIEPFATEGKGMIKEGRPSGIFRMIDKKPLRNAKAREVVKYIEEEFKTLPFASRWIIKKFKLGNYLINILVKEGIIEEYAQLPEVTSALVSQAEHTVRVADKPEILTKV